MSHPPGSDAESVTAEFAARFGGQPRLFRAPARVNIIGEHTDYNDGLALTITTALHSWAAIAPRADRCVRTYSTLFEQMAQTDIDHAAKTKQGDWFDYVGAVVASLRNEGLPIRGADLLIHGNIPLGGGLSSSASLEVAIGRALLAVAGLDLAGRPLALLCQRAEVDFVGVRCGIMDQYSIACSVANMAILLDCRSISHELVALPQAARFIVIDSGIHHRLHQGAYNQRREECGEGLRLLQSRMPGIRALRDVSMPQLEEARPVLDDAVYRRCRHVVSEIQRVRLAHDTLRNSAAQGLGSLITASHDSLRDDFEVSCPELDELVTSANRLPGVLGARMMGAGFGGCMLCLIDSAKLEPTVHALIDAAAEVLGTHPWYHVVEACGAASEVNPGPCTGGVGVCDGR